MTSPFCTWTGGRIQNMDSPGPWTTPVDLQSWTKVLGTVLQYSYISVISRFPLKTMHPFQNFLAVLPPPTLYKVETRKKILDTRVQHCLWGEGRGWTCVNWKMPQKCKSVPRLLSTIVVHGSLCGPGHELPLWTTLIFEDEFC